MNNNGIPALGGGYAERFIITESASGITPTKLQIGYLGAVTTIDTVAVTGQFYAIQILEDANFSAFVAVGDSGSMTGFVVQAGMIIFGRVTAYTLASGKVRAYKSA